MPISVTCGGCGKNLKVKDEWAGKKGKCPTCGTTFAIPAGGAASAAPAMPGKRVPPKSAGKVQKKGSGGIAISWGPIIGVAFLLLVVGSIVAFLVGPRRVNAEWEKKGDDANNAVISVVTLAIQAYLSENGR